MRELRSEMSQAMALRKAELLAEDLCVEKQDVDYILGEHKGRTYQILVTYKDGINFESSTDLPPLDYHDSSGSMDKTPKSAIKEIKHRWLKKNDVGITGS